jgi:hypothetical protein
MRLDHLVLAVADLDAAASALRDGRTVEVPV